MNLEVGPKLCTKKADLRYCYIHGSTFLSLLFGSRKGGAILFKTTERDSPLLLSDLLLEARAVRERKRRRYTM